MVGHGFTWEQLRAVPVEDLAIGETWVMPGPGTAWRARSDGTVRGVGWMELDGTAWTLLSRDGDQVTACSHDGRETSQSMVGWERHEVLKVSVVDRSADVQPQAHCDTMMVEHNNTD